jgi:tetraacyldisaccharide 4'-kinase
MNKIVSRLLLWPFSLIYGGIISLRNVFYDAGLLKSTQFYIPVINVGNLSIGGTGKTPHIEYLIELLSPYLNVATLSRGYKRKSKGFRFVRHTDNAMASGDEPLQFKVKNPNITVAVAESRNIGIPMIVQSHPETQVILLDDAFQHRSVMPDLNILLTEYSNLFVDDYLIPSGRLREPRDAYKRADIITVTKCPMELSQIKKAEIISKLKPLDKQKVYFSKYKYLNPYFIFDPSITIDLKEDLHVVLISAIANVDYLLTYLENICEVDNVMKYEDHHYFSEYEVEQFKKINDNVSFDNSVFLTTEKDAMRLAIHKDYLIKHQIPIFVLPIEVEFIDNDTHDFNENVKSFLLNYKH